MKLNSIIKNFVLLISLFAGTLSAMEVVCSEYLIKGPAKRSKTPVKVLKGSWVISYDETLPMEVSTVPSNWSIALSPDTLLKVLSTNRLSSAVVFKNAAKKPREAQTVLYQSVAEGFSFMTTDGKVVIGKYNPQSTSANNKYDLKIILDVVTKDDQTQSVNAVEFSGNDYGIPVNRVIEPSCEFTNG